MTTNAKQNEEMTEKEKGTKEIKTEKHTHNTNKKSHSGSSSKTAAKKTKSATDKLKEKLKQAEKNGHEWQDKYIRLSAEFDNYRKRTLKEKAELTKTANESLLANILPLVDDVERGVNNLNEAKDIEGVKEGIFLIYNKFKEFLIQNGVKEIEADHKEFDIDLHEAVTKIPAPSKELKGKIVDVIQKGYMLNEKVIRYSKVIIGE